MYWKPHINSFDPHPKIYNLNSLFYFISLFLHFLHNYPFTFFPNLHSFALWYMLRCILSLILILYNKYRIKFLIQRLAHTLHVFLSLFLCVCISTQRKMQERKIMYSRDCADVFLICFPVKFRYVLCRSEST